jgi:hypothetical protein
MNTHSPHEVKHIKTVVQKWYFHEHLRFLQIQPFSIALVKKNILNIIIIIIICCSFKFVLFEILTAVIMNSSITL